MLRSDAVAHQQALWVQSGPTPAKNGWRRRAEMCPNAPEVLRAAAHGELMRQQAVPAGELGAKELDKLARDIRRSRRRVVRWYDRIEEELELRGLALRAADYYLVAWARLGRGEFERAHKALRRASAGGGVSPSRSHRLAALIALFEGRLSEALRRSRHSLAGTAGHEEVVSLYIYAVALDRAGDTAEAKRVFRGASKRDRGGRKALLMAESMMPVHERLYLRALDRHFDSTPSAAIRLWQAYLLRPEPAAPERRLAQRHLAALDPIPEPVPEGEQANPEPEM